MVNKIWYPRRSQVIRANKLMVEKFPASKSERHHVLGSYKIDKALQEAKSYKGSNLDKSAVLLRSLANEHPFASANRRTAYFITNQFLWKNEGYGIAKDKPNGQEFMRKVRMGEISHKQIKKQLARKKVW